MDSKVLPVYYIPNKITIKETYPYSQTKYKNQICHILMVMKPEIKPSAIKKMKYAKQLMIALKKIKAMKNDDHWDDFE